MIDPLATVNNRAPANIGQAKWMAKSALEALRAVDPDCAAAIEADLVGPGKIIASWNAPVTDTEKETQHAPLLIGQLKAISAPFYDHLNTVAPDWLASERLLNGTSNAGTHYPWTAITADDANKAVANIGQLKAVFSLRFETLPPPSTIPDEWFILYFGSVGISGSDDDPDGDGLTNAEEYQLGTDPTVNGSGSSDGGGETTVDDAAPNDNMINWKRSPEGKFLWIQVPSIHGFQAVHMSGKGHILFRATESIEDYATQPVGKVWDPSKGGAERLKDIFFNPAPFKLRMLNLPRDGSSSSITLQDVPHPMVWDSTNTHSIDVRVHSIGSDGSVLANVAYQYEEDEGEDPESPEIRISPSLGNYVFFWGGGGYGSCKLVGEDRGFRDYVVNPTPWSSWTNNYAVGFREVVSGGQTVIHAVVADQDSSQVDDYTSVTIYSFPVGSGGALGGSVSIDGMADRYHSPSLDSFSHRFLTPSGKVGIPFKEAFDSTVISRRVGGHILPQNSYVDSITDLPPGAAGTWALGCFDGPLRISSGSSFPSAQSAAGVLRFDRQGVGIGNGRNNQDIWRNDEWYALEDLVEDENLTANFSPREITPSGLIWVSSDDRMSNGILVPFDIQGYKRGTINGPGEKVSKGSGEYGQETVVLENGDSEGEENSTEPDYTLGGNINEYRKGNDDDLVKIVLRWPKGTKIEGARLELRPRGLEVDPRESENESRYVENDAPRLRFFKPDGTRLSEADLIIENLSRPGGSYLAEIFDTGELILFAEGVEKFGSIDPYLNPLNGAHEQNSETLAQARDAGQKLGGAILNFEFSYGETTSRIRLLVYRGGYLHFRIGETTPPLPAKGILGTFEFRDGKGRTSASGIDEGNVLFSWSARSGTASGAAYNVSNGGGHTPPGWYLTYQRTDITGGQRDQFTGSGQNRRIRQGSYVRWSQDDEMDPNRRYTTTYECNHSLQKDLGIGEPTAISFKWQMEVIPPTNAANRDQLQIHPDGKQDGTKGCIGIQRYSDCDQIDYVLRQFHNLKVFVEIKPLIK